MYSVKVVVRTNYKSIYITDEMITNGMPCSLEAVMLAISRALELYLSPDTLSRVAQCTFKNLSKTNNTTSYKQIIEQNINGCYFKVYIKKEALN